jgi:predicted DNA-binding transcriptional regulator AlpA
MDARDLTGRLLNDDELMAVLGIKKTSFYQKKKEHLFEFLETRPQLTGYTQYSGTLVQRWLDGAGRVHLKASEPKPGPRLVNARASR